MISFKEAIGTFTALNSSHLVSAIKHVATLRHCLARRPQPDTSTRLGERALATASSIAPLENT